MNSGCYEKLAEPSSAFPSNNGSLDGAHAAIWGGTFGNRLAPIASLACRDDIRLLAYRYGLLVAVSPQTLLTFRWDGHNWTKNGVAVPFPDPHGFEPGSLILDDGYAFIIGNNRAFAVSITDSAVFKDFPGVYACQTKDERHWVALHASEDGRTEVLVVDTTLWEEDYFTIDLNINEITGAVLRNGLHISTDGHGVFTLDIDTGATNSYPELSDCRCIRIASLNDRLLTIGYDSARQLCLWSINGTSVNAIPLLYQNVVAEFSASPNNIFVACVAGILPFERDMLTRNLNMVNLPENADTKPDMLAISDNAGNSRLLLKRSSPGRIETNLVNPQTGAVDAIAATPNMPILCVADSKLVIASREGPEMKVRTYIFQEAR